MIAWAKRAAPFSRSINAEGLGIKPRMVGLSQASESSTETPLAAITRPMISGSSSLCEIAVAVRWSSGRACQTCPLIDLAMLRNSSEACTSEPLNAYHPCLACHMTVFLDLIHCLFELSLIHISEPTRQAEIS